MLRTGRGRAKGGRDMVGVEERDQN